MSNNKLICSVCLNSSASVRCVMAIKLRSLYIKIISPLDNLFSGLDIQMCYLCYAAFKKIYKFIDVAAKSYEKLKNYYIAGLQVPQDIDKGRIHNLSVTSIPSININEQSDSKSLFDNMIVKQEYIEPDEASRNSVSDKKSEKHPVQTDIRTKNSPTQVIQTVSPLTNKRISVTLSLPPNHKIKKTTKVLNPAQNKPIVKSLPFSQVFSKNQVLLNTERRKHLFQKGPASFTMQSSIKLLPNKTPNILKRPSIQIRPTSLKSTLSQVPVSIPVTNTIPTLVPSTAPLNIIPALVPISLPNSVSIPIFTSTEAANQMNISFRASAPTPVSTPLPTLMPLTFMAPNSALPCDQSQKINTSVSKKLTVTKSKSKTDKLIPLIWHDTTKSPANKGTIIRRVARVPKYKAPVLKQSLPLSEPVKPNDAMKSNINKPTTNGDSDKSTDANNMYVACRIAPKHYQRVPPTAVMKYVKIAPKPNRSINNRSPGLAETPARTEVKKIERLGMFSCGNKNLESLCDVEEDIEDIKIWYGDDDIKEEVE